MTNRRRHERKGLLYKFHDDKEYGSRQAHVPSPYQNDAIP